MSKKSWHLDRRSFLRGAGVACALPWLEGMGHAGSPATIAPKRLCYVYFPNGCSLPGEQDTENARWRWFPSVEGRDFVLTDVLSSLEPFREQLSIYGGLSHPKSRHLLGHLAGDTYLTAGDMRGSEYKNSISIDQVAARELGKHTRYPSLVFSTDGGVGYKSRVSTLSFDVNGRPIPSEHRQRQIFERYFSSNGGATTDERRRSLARGRRIVDTVLEDSRRLRRRLGGADQEKLDEFLSSLDSVEAQIERNEAWLDVPTRPVATDHLELDPDPRADPTAYLRSTFDLMVLAFQTDLTRVITHMLGREDGMGFGDNFPKLALGIPKSHHTISHDTVAGHWEEWGRFDQWYARQFAYFVERLAATHDEHGPLLDRSLVLYGSCCSTTHNSNNYPLALVGGKALGLGPREYRVHDDSIPLSNLFVSMLQAVDVPIEHFGDSTGTLPGFLA